MPTIFAGFDSWRGADVFGGGLRSPVRVVVADMMAAAASGWLRGTPRAGWAKLRRGSPCDGSGGRRRRYFWSRLAPKKFLVERSDSLRSSSSSAPARGSGQGSCARRRRGGPVRRGLQFQILTGPALSCQPRSSRGGRRRGRQGSLMRRALGGRGRSLWRGCPPAADGHQHLVGHVRQARFQGSSRGGDAPQT